MTRPISSTWMGEDGRQFGCQDNETRIRQNRSADRHRHASRPAVPLDAPSTKGTTPPAPATGRRRSITIARAVQEDPNNAEYRIALERAMISASQVHLDAARIAEARGQLDDALREYRRASEFDPPNRQHRRQGRPSSNARIRDQIEASAPAQLRAADARAGAPGGSAAAVQFEHRHGADPRSTRPACATSSARSRSRRASTSCSTARSRTACTRCSLDGVTLERGAESDRHGESAVLQGPWIRRRSSSSRTTRRSGRSTKSRSFRTSTSRTPIRRAGADAEQVIRVGGAAAGPGRSAPNKTANTITSAPRPR